MPNNHNAESILDSNLDINIDADSLVIDDIEDYLRFHDLHKTLEVYVVYIQRLHTQNEMKILSLHTYSMCSMLLEMLRVMQNMKMKKKKKKKKKKISYLYNTHNVTELN